jgi:uncharacterized membrane protein YeaQ/YmgE (transglycosylase-associated protein family)
MNLIIILIVGAVVGWLAGIITRSGGGLLFDILVGIAGALIAGWLFGGGASILNGPLNLMSFLYSLLGAVILLLDRQAPPPGDLRIVTVSASMSIVTPSRPGDVVDEKRRRCRRRGLVAAPVAGESR